MKDNLLFPLHCADSPKDRTLSCEAQESKGIAHHSNPRIIPIFIAKIQSDEDSSGLLGRGNSEIRRINVHHCDTRPAESHIVILGVPARILVGIERIQVEAAETRAYSVPEIEGILALLPEPAATAFAIAAYSGLRIGEIEGLDWTDYENGELHVSRSVWNGHINDPKTKKSRAAVPVIRQLALRLDMHRLRSGNPGDGPMFKTTKGTRLSMHNVRERDVLPALNKCEQCGKSADDHAKADHTYSRDSKHPEWYGWHACRRGLGSNLYRQGVPDVVIQRILRHANVSTTLWCYVKTISDDVREAMTKLENSIPRRPVGHQLDINNQSKTATN
jgi:integrase